MISTDGICLRTAHPDDRARWLEMLHDPEQLSFGSPPFVSVPTSVEALDEQVAESVTAFEDRAPGRLCIAEASDPTRVLGVLDWRRHGPPQMEICEIGYVVHPDARGRGVGRRGIRAMVQWLTLADDGPRQARVQLEHSVENPPSCRVALAAGFEREGLRRAFLPLRDPEAPGGVRRHDVCLHGLVSERLRAATG